MPHASSTYQHIHPCIAHTYTTHAPPQSRQAEKVFASQVKARLANIALADDSVDAAVRAVEQVAMLYSTGEYVRGFRACVCCACD